MSKHEQLPARAQRILLQIWGGGELCAHWWHHQPNWARTPPTCCSTVEWGLTWLPLDSIVNQSLMSSFLEVFIVFFKWIYSETSLIRSLTWLPFWLSCKSVFDVSGFRSWVFWISFIQVIIWIRSVTSWLVRCPYFRWRMICIFIKLGLGQVSWLTRCPD